jgi:transcriptional regulator with XRE-family HTH domain
VWTLDSTSTAAQRERDRVAGYLRLARQARGLSQARLALLIDVLPQQLSRWEIGLWEPNAEHREQLAQALEVPEHFFFSGIGLR